MWWMALVLVGCDSESAPECGEAECAAVCDSPAEEPPPSNEMSEFEASVIGPAVEDIRAGIRAWNEQSVGVCARTSNKSKECAEFLGLEAGTLPEGSYMLQALLRVPDAGPQGTWSVTINVDCTTTRVADNNTSTYTNNYNKSYTVKYINEERGYRLAPLYSIESPNTAGKKDCTYTLSYAHPDSPSTVTGSWSIPQG